MDKATETYANALLQEHLKHELPSDEFSQFARFCQKVNHELVGNTLKEVRGVAKAAEKAKRAGDLPPALLPRIYRVYHRKLGEQHRLFPVFELFETSYRSFLALWLETHYGKRNWWDEPYRWLREGKRATDLRAFNGTAVSFGVTKVTETLLRNVDEGILTGNVVPKLKTGQELLRLSKLSDLEGLCREHWPEFRVVLPERLGNGNPLDAPVFESMFARVRKARNMCFHHKEVTDRAGIVSNAELLLDLINVHASTVVDSATCAPVKPFVYQVAHEERHAHGLVDMTEFTVETVSGVGRIRKTVAARSGTEAIAKALAGLTAAEQDGLTSLSIVDGDDRWDDETGSADRVSAERVEEGGRQVLGEVR